MNEHEEAFVSAFIVSQRRSRYMRLLANAKQRPKILERLNHSLDLDLRNLSVTRFARPSPDEIERLVCTKGKRSICHIIADASCNDGLDLPVREALDFAIYHTFGVVVSYIPGKVAFYKPESPGPKLVLINYRPVANRRGAVVSGK